MELSKVNECIEEIKQQGKSYKPYTNLGAGAEPTDLSDAPKLK